MVQCMVRDHSYDNYLTQKFRDLRYTGVYIFVTQCTIIIVHPHFPFPSLAAVDGQDYLGFTETLLRFEPSEEELQLTVDLMDDSVVEFTEEFQVVLLPGDGETGVKFPRGQQSTVQILDDNDCKMLRI